MSVRTVARDTLIYGAAAITGAALGRFVAKQVAINREVAPYRSPGPSLVRCAGCGILGQWTDPTTVVNASGGDVPALCSETFGRRVRAHGPWLPEPAQ